MSAKARVPIYQLGRELREASRDEIVATCVTIRGNKIVVKIVPPSAGSFKIVLGKRRGDRESVPSPSVEDVAQWLHVLSISGIEQTVKKGGQAIRGE